MYRLRWKRALIETLGKSYNATDAPVYTSLSSENPKAFHRYRLCGSWNDFQNGYALVGPRMLEREFGYKLIYPFRLESGEFALIDVGWIPQNAPEQHAANFQSQFTNPTAELETISVPSEGQFRLSWLLGTKRDGIFSVKNCKSIAQALGIPAPYENVRLFQALPTKRHEGKGCPRRVTIKPEQIPNRHLEYVITW